MIEKLGSLVSCRWLADHLGEDGLFVLDASRHLPAAQRDPLSEFEAGHIPSARFFDLASLTDTSSSVPAALPRPEQVAQRLAELGVGEGAKIVLYDDSALKSSARAWFSLTQCAVPHVAILDGGMAKWRAEGRPIEINVKSREPVAPSTLRAPIKVVTKAQMLVNCGSREVQVLDARGADRVFGSGIDPVHGGQNGRIPGALNLPFGKVFDSDGTYKSADDLRALFENAGVAMTQPLVMSCGSGVTASVLLFAAHLAGKDDVRLYDGSWQEWEADPETPKEQGPLEQGPLEQGRLKQVPVTTRPGKGESA
ncbi:MAG: sulfurtransferase [Erythrobacter sp.]|uniref:sulfurtransferase n=1 Tax=Erythrobacter sp. TaxID=1042 RepID=UPI003264DC34